MRIFFLQVNECFPIKGQDVCITLCACLHCKIFEMRTHVPFILVSHFNHLVAQPGTAGINALRVILTCTQYVLKVKEA